MKKISGFVFQDDVLFNTMTVRETLMMSATLRLPDSIPREQKIRRVDEIIGLLGLEKAKDTIIGTPEKKGISGGERKRTAIGMEMIIDPMVIFLDEPTSGLDTFTAYSVVSQLRDLARTGRTVVATIHQPSSKTFMLFDDLLLLAEGRVVYHGPLSEVLDYFSALGHVCPTYMNPADFLFMEVLNDVEALKDSSSSTLDIAIADGFAIKSKSNAYLIDSWSASPQHQALLNHVQTSRKDYSDLPGDLFAGYQRTRSSIFTQFSFLCGRVGRDMIRNKMGVTVRFMKAAFIGLIMALFYKGIPNKTGFALTQDRVNVLFFLCTNEFFSSTGNAVFLFSFERGVFLREYRNGYYSLLPYFVSKSLLEIPLALIAPFISVSIMYPIVGLKRQWGAYAGILFSAQLISMVAAAMGLMLGAIFPDFSAAMALLPAFTLPMMLFSGIQLSLKTIPWYVKFMPYVSPLRWAFHAMAKIEFTGITLENLDSMTNVPHRGEEALALFTDGPVTVAQSWLILFAFFICFTVAGLFFLWRIAKK